MNNIIISAFAVSPFRGSECAVGWEITTRLAKHFDVTVLMCDTTPSNNHYFREVESHIIDNTDIKNIHFVPVKMPESSIKYTRMHDFGFWPAYYWGYKCWQKEAFKIAKTLHIEKKFVLAYQLNMIGFREPGYLWRLNIPFIWGPTNGFHSIPFSFIRGFNGKEFIFQIMKHIANETQIKLSFRAKKAAKKAEIVWCVDETALQKMLSWHAKAELMQETGYEYPSENLPTKRNYDGIRCLNLVWSGMITTGKALEILIDALIIVKDLNYHLTVIGDGPLANSIKNKSKQIKDKITWTGWVDRKQVLFNISNSDLLVFTSLKEATSVTIMEALGLCVPVVCHDTCGMGAVINEMNGFKIPYINTNTSIEFIADLLNQIVSNPTILNNRYETISSSAQGLTWDEKVKTIAKRIDDILTK
jgi:glycosyltransferase involved in cell wall biosynthesis